MSAVTLCAPRSHLVEKVGIVWWSELARLPREYVIGPQGTHSAILFLRFKALSNASTSPK